VCKQAFEFLYLLMELTHLSMHMLFEMLSHFVAMRPVQVIIQFIVQGLERGDLSFNMGMTILFSLEHLSRHVLVVRHFIRCKQVTTKCCQKRVFNHYGRVNERTTRNNVVAISFFEYASPLLPPSEDGEAVRE